MDLVGLLNSKTSWVLFSNQSFMKFEGTVERLENIRKSIHHVLEICHPVIHFTFPVCVLMNVFC